MEHEKYTTHFKQLFKLSFPVMLSEAGQVLVGIADSMMVGQVGATQLAAASFANAIFFVIMVIGMGIAYGMNPLVASALGEKNEKKIGRILKNGLFVNSLTGIVLFLVMIGMMPLMKLMGQEPEVMDEALPYFFVLALSIVPQMVYFNFKRFNEGLASTKPTMYITLGSNVLNVFLNYLLIYGNWGFPQLGLLGAGYATLISRIIMSIALAIYTFRDAYFAPYIKQLTETKIKLEECLKIYRIGIPIAGQMLMEVTVFATGAVMIGQIGKDQLAAHQSVISLAALTYMIANGLGAGTTVRVSNQLGKRDFVNMRRAAHVGTGMIVVFMLMAAAIFVIFKNELPDLFVKDDDIQVVLIAAELMVIAGFFQLFDGIQVVALGALRGIHDVRVPTLLTLIAYWVFGMPTCYVLGFVFNMGVTGVWYGFLVGLGSASILLAIRFEFVSKRMLSGKIVLPDLQEEESTVEV